MSESALARRLGYEFNDPELFEKALRHRSVGPSNNERLEFLGDAVLGLIIGQALFERFPGAKEGELTRARARLVKEPTLADIARDMNIGTALQLGSGELKSGGRSRDSILSDALEAIIGAIYLDGGFDAAAQSVLAWFDQRLGTINPQKLEKDPKTQLQELLQSRSLPLPDYQVIEESGEPHQRFYRVQCSVQGQSEQYLGEGTGRRRAEQNAAAQALLGLTGGQHQNGI